ncbi:MAG TPA: alpha/beta hydrolase [Jiangellaceae bacterium]|nr:alpha/beta hydrolase [Jiangellaceae bacterium]
MGFIKVRGINFYYEEKGEGPPILLIPPSGSTASTWGAFFGDLAGLGRVIAYDRRGYSRSGGKTVRSASEHTADAAGILEALEASPAVAVGTSAGAAIALRLAVRRPDLVRAAVLHESPWRALRHPSAPALGMLARMEWQARRGRYAEATETLLRFVYAYRDGGSAWDQFPEEWRRTAKENGKSVIADLESTILGYPRPKDLAKITAPFVCTYGSRSPSYMRAHHAHVGPGHPDSAGMGDRRRRSRRHVRRAGQLRPRHRRSDSFIGASSRYLRFPPRELVA